MPEYRDYGSDAPKEFYFKVAGRPYVVVEADVDAVTKYKNKLLSTIAIGENMQPTKMEGSADVEPFLVHLCCYIVDENDVKTSKRTPEATIRGWRPGVVKDLVKWIRQNSDLDDDDQSKGNE